MPWCAGCDRFLSPSTVTPVGTCPRCGAAVDPGRARAPDAVAASPAPAPATGAPEGDADDVVPIPLPWHFKLLVGAIVVYLGWRAIQGVIWLLDRL